MTKSNILLNQTCKIPVKLTHNCINENGIESDEIFTILNVIGDFEQITIINQYNQEICINPNQLI